MSLAKQMVSLQRTDSSSSDCSTSSSDTDTTQQFEDSPRSPIPELTEVEQRVADGTTYVLDDPVAQCLNSLLRNLAKGTLDKYGDGADAKCRSLEDWVGGWGIHNSGGDNVWENLHVSNTDEELKAIDKLIADSNPVRKPPVKKVSKGRAVVSDEERNVRDDKCLCRVWRGGKGGGCCGKATVGYADSTEPMFCKQHAEKVSTITQMAEDGEIDCVECDEAPLYVLMDGQQIPKWRLGFIGDALPQKEIACFGLGKTHMFDVGTLYSIGGTGCPITMKWKVDAQ